MLDAILTVFPLDTYVEHPVNLMEVMKGDPVETPIWDTYAKILKEHDDRGGDMIGPVCKHYAAERRRDQLRESLYSVGFIPKVCLKDLLK